MRLGTLGPWRSFVVLAVISAWTITANAATKHVNVGAGILFTDVTSGSTGPAVTHIFVGDTVEWDWLGGGHSTTSGTCGGSSCTPDGLWDSPVQGSGSFTHTFNSPGTFHYFCRPHQALMQGTVIVSLPPDFGISVSNTSFGTIFPSQQAVFNGNLTPMNGYNNTINLSCQPGGSSLPSPCTPNPGSPMVSSTTPFTITAGASSPGHYDFVAQGADGSLTHTASGLNFDVVDFGISAPTQSTLTAFANTTTLTTSVNLTAAGSFAGSVSLSCSGLPAGATCNFMPAGPYMPTASTSVPVNVTITVPTATVAQDYNVTLSATAASSVGSVTKNQSVTLHVIDSILSTQILTAFTNATSPAASVNLTAGGSFNSAVTLSCSAGLPAGATCGFSPVGPYYPVANNPVPVTLTVNVPPATTTQDYNITLASATGGVTKNQTFTLHVVSFAISAFTPGTITIGAGNASNGATTMLTGSTNFTGTVSFACTAGLPPGGSCSFSPTIASSYPSSPSVTASVPFNSTAGTPTLTVTATGNLNGASAAQTQSLTLSVPAPDFALSAPSPATVSMVDHSFSQPVTVLLTPTNMAGTVTPGCTGLPANVSCIFSPPSVVVNGQPTRFTVVFEASGAAANNYAGITINAGVTINGTPISHGAALTQLGISIPGTTTTITSNMAAANSVTNSSTLTGVGDPSLTITATVSNAGTTYSAAVWQVNFSSPVLLVASSNPNCSQALPTAISCNLGDIAVSIGNHYSFKVAPLFGRSVVASSTLTSPTVGSIDLTGNLATAPTVQVRVRPLARKGLVPKTP